MRTPAKTQARARKTQTTSFPPPTGGWISNRNIAAPRGPQLPPGAAILENWLPTATSIILRRGSKRWATLPSGPVTSLFTYSNGGQREMFAANAEGIWNVTSVPEAYTHVIANENDDWIAASDTEAFGWGSVDGMDVLTGQTSGDWVTIQFSTAGGTFLVGVNGEDPAFVYDGSGFFPNHPGGIFELPITNDTAPFTAGDVLTGATSGATATILSVTPSYLWIVDITGTFDPSEAITDGDGGAADTDGAAVMVSPGVGISFPAGSGLTTADLSYVWNYKNRLWFIEKNSLNVWYLPVDQIGGELTLFPLGGVLNLGGSLMFGASWSLDSGLSGGLGAQCVFVTQDGEVAVYQGSNPSSASDWSLVGVYRIGKPMGHKAHILAGGDLVIATAIGFIPLSQAVARDYAAISPAALSNPIEVAWDDAATSRGQEGWNCLLWAEGGMAIVSPPTPNNTTPMVFVANANTGAWAPFTNWDARCMCSFDGRLFFGTSGGAVVQGYTGGDDQGDPYTGRYLPLFDDMGTAANRKPAELARVVMRSNVSVSSTVTAMFDWNMDLPPVPDAVSVPALSVWDAGVWDQSIWDAGAPSIVCQRWRSVGGWGYAMAIAVQVTSGASIPLDAEIIRTDLTWATGDIVS